MNISIYLPLIYQRMYDILISQLNHKNHSEFKECSFQVTQFSDLLNFMV